MSELLRCGCGYEYPAKCGEWGCPNCEGDEGPGEELEPSSESEKSDN